MKSLDRAIKRDRAKRYRSIKKLFKARDASSKYIKASIRVSFLDKMLGVESARFMTTTNIAKFIVDNADNWLKPPHPPAHGKPSITKLQPNPPEAPKPVIGRRN